MHKFAEIAIKTAKAIAQDQEFDFKQINDENIQQILKQKNIAQFRGYTDSSALQHNFSDRNLTQKYMPEEDSAQQVYQKLEKIRCEIIGAQKYCGIAVNITATYKNQIKLIFQNDKKQNDISTQKITLNIALKLMQKIYNNQNEPIIKKFFQYQKESSENIVKDNLIAKMFDNIYDQEKFAQIIHETLETLGLKKKSTQNQQKDQRKDPQKDQRKNQQKDEKYENQSQNQSQKTQTSQKTEFEENKQRLKLQKQEKLKIKKNYQKNSCPYEKYIKKDAKYSIYTMQFDEEVEANKLAGTQELKNLRKQLDLHMRDMKKIVGGLVGKLQRKLMSRNKTQWIFNCEEGIIDNARLAGIVAAEKKNQGHNILSYKKETDEDFRETIVTLLLDNSGSMRGKPIINAAICADILAQTLEKCQVRVEILGFTTTQWKGGNSRNKWLENNSPDKPGRLNDLRHIIYKSADVIFRRVKNNLGLVLKDGILKENIDGEALIWAYARIKKYHEKRKILIVISDGAPVDDSSIAANEPLYLDSHLRRVIDYIENKSDVEITAIGIGHDVKRYYKQAITIKDSQQLTKVMIERVTELFAPEEKNNHPIKRRRRK